MFPQIYSQLAVLSNYRFDFLSSSRHTSRPGDGNGLDSCSVGSQGGPLSTQGFVSEIGIGLVFLRGIAVEIWQVRIFML